MGICYSSTSNCTDYRQGDHMKTLVLGASGATGRLVVAQLISQGVLPKIVIRPTANLPEAISGNNDIQTITGNVDEFSTAQFRELLQDCDSVISCLGHKSTCKGIFGKPRSLVFNAVRKITEVLNESKSRKKFIVMSTTAYTAKIHGEIETFGESIVFSLLKILLPPHADNVASGDCLFKKIKDSDCFEWIAIRPDALIDRDTVSDYKIVSARNRSPIFDPGKTSRINVAHFMASLVSDETMWQQWKFRAPVIYNTEPEKNDLQKHENHVKR